MSKKLTVLFKCPLCKNAVRVSTAVTAVSCNSRSHRPAPMVRVSPKGQAA